MNTHAAMSTFLEFGWTISFVGWFSGLSEQQGTNSPPTRLTRGILSWVGIVVKSMPTPEHARFLKDNHWTFKRRNHDSFACALKIEQPPNETRTRLPDAMWCHFCTGWFKQDSCSSSNLLVWTKRNQSSSNTFTQVSRYTQLSHYTRNVLEGGLDWEAITSLLEWLEGVTLEAGDWCGTQLHAVWGELLSFTGGVRFLGLKLGRDPQCNDDTSSAPAVLERLEMNSASNTKEETSSCLGYARILAVGLAIDFEDCDILGEG